MKPGNVFSQVGIRWGIGEQEAFAGGIRKNVENLD